jgi:NADH dehydrogenase [ubiquinone] 1 alpha subcomplex assembly factor 1
MSIVRFTLLSAVVLLGAFMSTAETNPELSTKLVVNFGPESDPWRNVDDSVMGGVSSSRMRIEDDMAIFEGELSLENNGGFASVRSEATKQDLTDFEGVRLRVRGDGKKYQFRIRSNGDYNGPSHQMTFETIKDEWLSIELPFSNFFATYRGRTISDHPQIDASRILTMAFFIADKQAGDFLLEIDWIKGYRDPLVTNSEE